MQRGYQAPGATVRAKRVEEVALKNVICHRLAG